GTSGGDMRHQKKRARRRVVVAEMMLQQPSGVVTQAGAEGAVLQQVLIEPLVGVDAFSRSSRLKSEADIRHCCPPELFRSAILGSTLGQARHRISSSETNRDVRDPASA